MRDSKDLVEIILTMTGRQTTLEVALAAFLGGFIVSLGSFYVLAKRRRNLPAPRRFGGAIRLKPERYKRYRELHDDIWDAVLNRIYDSNIRNFIIYYHEETSTLFSHFEWIGNRFTSNKEEEDELLRKDMEAIASDDITQEWWEECEPCQLPFKQWPSGKNPPSKGGKGDWWAPLECVACCGHWPVMYSPYKRDPKFRKRNK